MLIVDILIVAFLLFGVWQGFRHGFMALLFQMISLVLASLLSFWLLSKVKDWMVNQLQIPVSYAGPIGLGLLFMVFSAALGAIATLGHRLFAPILHANPLNRILGMVFGGVRQLIIAAIILTLLVSLPLPSSFKQAIDKSILAKPLISVSLKLEQYLAQRFNVGNLDAVAFNTTGKDESITTSLNYTVADPTVDEAGEILLFKLTNEVRKQAKVPELQANDTLRDVARAYGKNMLAKGYFSHFSPDGEDATKRIQKANITALAVGENLATAPEIAIAQAGLLASEGHRKNIINPDFNQVGIGVLDAGVHGKMVVEVFIKTP